MLKNSAQYVAMQMRCYADTRTNNVSAHGAGALRGLWHAMCTADVGACGVLSACLSACSENPEGATPLGPTVFRAMRERVHVCMNTYIHTHLIR